MKPTSRGWKFITVIAVLAISSLLFSDLLLTATCIVLLAVIAVALVNLVMRIRRARETRIEPAKLEISVKAGERSELLFKVYTEAPFIIRSYERWLSFDPENVEFREGILKIIVSSPRSGLYELSRLKASVLDLFGFLEAEIMIPLTLRVKVYPRVLPWIMEALRLVGEATVGFGEVPGRRKGHGLEYLWSREYQPGDPFMFIDWKATARLQEVIVKEFLEEGYGAVEIIYDVRAHGPVSKDECSAYFLSAVVSASRSGLPISVVIKNGEDVIISRENMNPVEALKLALAYVIESCIATEWSIYEFFEPKSARLVMDILRELRSTGLQEVVKVKLDSLLKDLRVILRERRAFVVYVGCVLSDSTFVNELATEVLEAGGRLIVFTPVKPWVDARGLEEAYLMYQSYNRALRALEKMGAEICFKEGIETLLA